MVNSMQTYDVKHLSSRKLWELVSIGALTKGQQQLAEQELILRRRHLDQSGTLYQASNLNQQQPCLHR
jgi:hypothetical protein